jgi:hypothetical protein
MFDKRRLKIDVVDASIKIKVNEVSLYNFNMDELKFIINKIDAANIMEIKEITPLVEEIFFVDKEDLALINRNIKKTITENSILFDITINSKKMIDTSLVVHIEKIRFTPLINTTKMIEIKINEINY